MRKSSFHVPLTILFLAAILSGCARTGTLVDHNTWLDYDGEYLEAVLACVRALPDNIEGRHGDFPAAAEVSEIAASAHPLDNVKTAYSVSGKLRLVYGATDQNYLWSCNVTQRWYTLQTPEISYELAE